MAKLSTDQAQEAAAEFSKGFGGVCNDAFDALSEDLKDEEIKAIVARAKDKLAKYDEVVGQLGQVHLDQFKADYDRKIERLRNNVPKLEAKIKAK